MPAVNWRDGLPVLMTSGCTVREPQLADAPLLLEALAHEDVERFLPDTPQTIPQFEWFIARVQRERRAGRCLCFTIVPNDPGKPVGLIQIRPRDPSSTTAEWGFVVGPRYRGRRLFAKSARLVLDYLFGQTKIARLEARVPLHNGSANRSLENLGGVVEGILRKSFIMGWQPDDRLLWALGRAPEVPGMSPFDTAQGQPASDTPWSLRSGLPELRGHLFRLREVELRDAADLVRMFEDLYVTRFLPPPPLSIPEFEQFIGWGRRQRAAGECATFVVDRDESQSVAGLYPQRIAGLYQVRRVDPTFHTAEWGVALAANQWGTGLFVASATLVIDFAFERLGVARLEARVAVANRRAGAALRKVGAIRENRMKRSFLLVDDPVDDATWAIAATRRKQLLSSG
ncbi:MAG: GNAT family N-acetyltransferase [Acidobacteria bacterium]|nr:GNAT family N-acetyltransferase [Acidobacteriota bacterium]